MADQGTIKVGDTVTHPQWEPEGATAKVLAVFSIPSRTGHRGKITEHVNTCHLDRHFPCAPGPHSYELDDHWMESGLVVVHGEDVIAERAARLRETARIAWNNWEDTPEVRALVRKRDEVDPISSAAWDKVVAAILAER